MVVIGIDTSAGIGTITGDIRIETGMMTEDVVAEIEIIMREDIERIGMTVAIDLKILKVVEIEMFNQNLGMQVQVIRNLEMLVLKESLAMTIMVRKRITLSVQREIVLLIQVNKLIPLKRINTTKSPKFMSFYLGGKRGVVEKVILWAMKARVKVSKANCE